MSLARFRTVGLIAAALAVAGTGLAVAAGVRLLDPHDTLGVLDVREVRFKEPEGEPPAWTVITAAPWTAAMLWDRGYVFVQLDAKGTPDADHYAVIRSDGLGLRGELFRVTPDGDPDIRLSGLTLWRRSDDSVSIRVPLWLLRFGPNRTFYRWWVVTTITGDKCPNGCIDRAPDDGSITQYRPGMSPSPTPPPSTAPPAT